MNLKKVFAIPSKQLFGTNPAILLYLSLYYGYTNNVRDQDPAGIKVKALAPSNGMEEFEIKLPNVFDIGISNEELQDRADKLKFVMVDFDGVTMTPYVFNNRSAISYKAKSMNIVGIMKGSVVKGNS